MIQAQDLRIGNWVSNGQIEFQITSKDIYHLDVYVNRVIAKPIPITPEWLERMGFAIDKSNIKGETVYVKGKCMLTESGDLIIINGWLDDENLTYSGYEVNDADNKYKYVHQLQNLYFALTGEELTINEE
jgi:hypothetical protein